MGKSCEACNYDGLELTNNLDNMTGLAEDLTEALKEAVGIIETIQGDIPLGYIKNVREGALARSRRLI